MLTAGAIADFDLTLLYFLLLCYPFVLFFFLPAFDWTRIFHRDITGRVGRVNKGGQWENGSCSDCRTLLEAEDRSGCLQPASPSRLLYSSILFLLLLQRLFLMSGFYRFFAPQIERHSAPLTTWSIKALYSSLLSLYFSRRLILTTTVGRTSAEFLACLTIYVVRSLFCFLMFGPLLLLLLFFFFFFTVQRGKGDSSSSLIWPVLGALRPVHSSFLASFGTR